MKFAIINDIHIGDYSSHKGIYRKNTPYAEKLLKDFVQKMNKFFKPDFVVQGGDYDRRDEFGGRQEKLQKRS